MRPGEEPERYIFKEDSSFGVMEGQVLVQEHARARQKRREDVEELEVEDPLS